MATCKKIKHQITPYKMDNCNSIINKIYLKKKNRTNPRKRTKQNRDNQPIRCRVQNTGDQDVQRTHWVWQKHKGRNGGHTKWNKEKYTGNHQWREGSQDSNEWFGT